MLDLEMHESAKLRRLSRQCDARPQSRSRWTAHALRALSAVAVAACAVAASNAARANQVVDYPDLGVRFALPAGWSGREIDGGLLLGSTTLPGLLLVLPHEHRDLAALRAEAVAGLGDNAATSLTLNGPLENIGNTALGGEFRGRFEGEPATAFVVGLINPHGAGLTVLAVTQPAKFTPAHRAAAIELARSVSFYVQKAPAIQQEWHGALANRRLARYASTYSSGGGGYSGFHSSVQLHLCAAGHFILGSRESGSFDTPGAFGSTRSGTTTHGQWQVVAQADGSPWLQLRHADGSTENYRLEMRGGSTYLNGARYFRVASERCR